MEIYFPKKVVKSQRSTKPEKKGSKAVFKVDNTTPDLETDQVSPLSNIESSSQILDILSVDSSAAQTKKVVAKAKKVTDQLREIQKKLLIGTLKEKDFKTLSHLADAIEDTEDNTLKKLVNEIKIRAAVEQAKFEK